MGRTRLKNLSIIAILVLALILAAKLTIFKKNWQNLENQNYISKLPEFSFTNIYGNEINSSALLGKYVFIQFVNPIIIDDLQLIKDIYRDFKKNISIIIFIKKFDIAEECLSTIIQDITVCEENYDGIKSIFNVPDCCESFYIFDPNGKLISANSNYLGYETAIKPLLLKIFKDKEFTTSRLVIEGKNLREFAWFSHLNTILENEDAEYYIISLFNSICASCISGQIVEKLKKIHERVNPLFYCLVILSEDFSDNDLANLKSQLDIQFKLMKADNKLNEKWNQLSNEFSSSDLNNILILIDGRGQVIKTAEPKFESIKDFFSLIESKIRKQNVI
jgi:hypothetical protein